MVLALAQRYKYIDTRDRNNTSGFEKKNNAMIAPNTKSHVPIYSSPVAADGTEEDLRC